MIKKSKTKKKDAEMFEEDIQIDFSENNETPRNSFSKSQSSELAKLKDKLKVCKLERQEYLDGWQRARAEMVNMKERLEAEISTKRARGENAVLEDLLPILDSFEMAMKNKEVWEAVDKNWRMGIEYIKKQIETLLTDYGVSEIAELGRAFDPEIHSPVAVVYQPEKKETTILEIVQKGYRRNEGTILRVARVNLSTKEKGENTSEDIKENGGGGSGG